MTDEQIMSIWCGLAVIGDKLHDTDVIEFARALLSASKPAAPEGLRITDQGIQFGNAWYSHEKITGYSAEQLNAGFCRVTGRAYMAWLQTALAASRRAAQVKE